MATLIHSVSPWLPAFTYLLGIFLDNSHRGVSVFLYIFGFIFLIYSAICAIFLWQKQRNCITWHLVGIFLFFIVRVLSLEIYLEVYLARIILNGSLYQACKDSAEQISKNSRINICSSYRGWDDTDIIMYDELGEINMLDQSAEWVRAASKMSFLFTTEGYVVYPLKDNFFLVRFFFDKNTDNNLIQKYNKNHRNTDR